MKEFKVNEHITLKLEEDTTVIYVNGERFDHCKFLLLVVPVEEITNLDVVDSIDEAAERLDNALEHPDDARIDKIPPETEFWGHCSNLQVWAENNYDTRLLHSNLSFPLLKELTNVGDPLAKRVFKEEVAKRLESGYPPVVRYLLSEAYLDCFTEEEIKAIEINLDGEKNIEINHYSKDIEIILDVAAAWYDLGYSFDKIEDDDKASACFEKANPLYQAALEIDPHNAETWNSLGNVYYFKGEHDKEDECYDKSIEINPDYADPWYNKACVESIRNNFKKSLKLLKRAIELKEYFKKRAQSDPDFKILKTMKEFKALIK